MVGHHFVAALMRQTHDYHVTVFGAEARVAYDRVHLSEVFAGRSPEDLALSTAEQYASWGVDLALGEAVTAISRDKREVVTSKGRHLAYDKLVLATGSYPFVPPVPGHDLERCVSYRTVDDLEKIRALAGSSRVGVVVGGGLLGLECANALVNLGLETHVVEFAPGLMTTQLDEGGSAMLRCKIEALGVQVHTSRNTREILARDDGSLRMAFSDDTHLDTDMLVFSAGIRPQDQLARDSELDMGERGGVVIDERCQTSDPRIYAIGECALYQGRIFGLVAPGYRMAETAVAAVTAGEEQFTGADLSTKLKLLGVDVGAIGDAHGRTANSLSVVYSNPKTQTYKRLVTSADGKYLLGAVLVGDCQDYQSLLQYYLNRIELADVPESLMLGDNSPSAAEFAASLPLNAMVCTCHNVSKEEILTAIQAGHTSRATLQSATKASTGCGSCADLLQSFMDNERPEAAGGETVKMCDPSMDAASMAAPVMQKAVGE